MIQSIFNPCLLSFRDLLFPPLCLHCRQTIHESSAYLCTDCTMKLELIDPNQRCPFCFSMEFCCESKRCSSCKPGETPIDRMGAACDYLGPAASIVRRMKYGNQPYLSKGAAGLMVAQFVQLGWPMPDCIVPVPISLTHLIERGYNQTHLLAQEISTMLGKPLHTPLKRLSGDYSQAGMSLSQRANLSSTSIKLKPNHQLCDKRILLIDDVMTSGSTLKRCAEALYGGYPSQIYALTFCRALKDVS